jgi:hypothetical protein
MPRVAALSNVSASAPVVSYQPSGVRDRGRGVAYEWLLPDVLRFVEKGIELKRTGGASGLPYTVGYDRVRLEVLERVRRWLLKAQRSAQPLVEVHRPRGTLWERYHRGSYVSVARWFSRFACDGRHRSIYCPWCRTSYANGKEKFVTLGPYPSLRRTSRQRAPTGLTCPRGHLLERQ